MTEAQSIALPDDRRLGYCCLDQPEGHSLFFFNDTPSPRLAISADDAFTNPSTFG